MLNAALLIFPGHLFEAFDLTEMIHPEAGQDKEGPREDLQLDLEILSKHAFLAHPLEKILEHMNILDHVSIGKASLLVASKLSVISKEKSILPTHDH